MVRVIKKLAAVAVVLGGFAGAASATEPAYRVKAVTTYKTVTVYVTKEVPVTVAVVKYDAYGCAYKAHETRYKTVEVPVQKTVAVTEYVKVPACDY